jgi:hypothetical protein
MQEWAAPNPTLSWREPCLAAPLVLLCFQNFSQRGRQRLPVCSLIHNEGLEGAGQEYQILPSRPVVRIVEVHPNSVVESSVIAVGNLPRTRSPW